MNTDHIVKISKETKISPSQVSAVATLLADSATIPFIARYRKEATGGLDDTVEAFDGKAGTGFKFVEYSPEALLTTIREAVEAYRQPKQWRLLMQNCMGKDFSWASSAKRYIKIFQGLQKAKTGIKGARQASNA